MNADSNRFDFDFLTSALIGVDPWRKKFCLSADVHHGAGRGHEVRLPNVMALFFALHNADDEIPQLIIGRASPQEATQIVIPNGEEAGANLAVRRQPDAAAMPAEGVRHGS